MRKLLVCVGWTVMLSGCSITQKVDPVDLKGVKEVCIIRNPAVRTSFLEALEAAVKGRGLSVRILEENAPLTECNYTVTYVARWSWDVALYMSYTEIKVYENGKVTGQASYDSRSGSGNMAKFINAEEKVKELVAQLFARP